MSEVNIVKTLASMAKLMPGGERIDSESAQFLVGMLGEYDSQKVQSALTRCFKELKFFPTIAEIVDRIDDGRPGTEEAWALCPKQDNSAAYLTDEIMAAWTVASSILEDDGGMVSARMAFKEVYEKTVKEKRANGLSPKWFLTRAFGPGSELMNESAVRIAIEKGRLPAERATAVLPSFVGKAPIGIEQKENPDRAEILKLIQGTFKRMDNE